MKTLVCLLIFIFFLACDGYFQSTAAYIFNINKLSAEGRVLDKGWRFAVDDNPAYASLSYDDSKWQPVDLTKDIHDIPGLWENSRADSIVKGMLQHSIASTGKRELTDINALVDESLRLSYEFIIQLPLNRPQ